MSGGTTCSPTCTLEAATAAASAASGSSSCCRNHCEEGLAACTVHTGHMVLYRVELFPNGLRAWLLCLGSNLLSCGGAKQQVRLQVKQPAE